MLHLVHLPSGRVINVGESIEEGFLRLADSTTLARGALVPCVRLTDGRGIMYSLVEERPLWEYPLIRWSKFRDYQVIGD